MISELQLLRGKDGYSIIEVIKSVLCDGIMPEEINERAQEYIRNKHSQGWHVSFSELSEFVKLSDIEDNDKKHVCADPETCNHGLHWYDMSPSAKEIFSRMYPDKLTFTNKHGSITQRPHSLPNGFAFYEHQALEEAFPSDSVVKPVGEIRLRDNLFPARQVIVSYLEKRQCIAFKEKVDTDSVYTVYEPWELPEWLESKIITTRV